MIWMDSKLNKIWEDFSKDYAFAKATIRDCSWDDAKDSYLLDSSKGAFDFDKISEEVSKNILRCKKPKSVDCLYIDNDNLFLVEFKNSTKNKWDDIKMKVQDTILLLNYLYNFSNSEFKSIQVIIVTAKSDSPNRGNRRHLDSRAQSSCPSRLLFLEKVYQVNISTVECDKYAESV